MGDEIQRRARAKIPDYDKFEHGARKLTVKEDKWAAELVHTLSTNAFRDWLRNSALSSEAQRRMVEQFASAERSH